MRTQKTCTAALALILTCACVLAGCGKTSDPKTPTSVLPTNASTTPTKATEETTTAEAPTNPTKDPSKITEADFYGTWYGDYGEVMEIKEKTFATYTDVAGKHDCYWAWMDKEFDLIDPNGDTYYTKTYRGDGVLAMVSEVSGELLILYQNRPDVVANRPEGVKNLAISAEVTGDLHSEYDIKITKAELFYNKYGEESIRCYFEITNRSGEACVLSSNVGVRLFQDGRTIYEYTDDKYINYESKTYDRFYIFSREAFLFRKTKTRNGSTITAAAEFPLDWNGSHEVTFQVRHYLLTAAEMHNALDKLSPSETYKLEATFTWN